MSTLVELFAQGLHLYQAGQCAQAQHTLRQVLNLAPRHGGALHMLGAMAYQSGQHAEAAEFFRQAVAADPGNAFFQSSLGAAYQTLGKLPEARAHHELAVRLSPRDPSVLNNLGITLAALLEADQAVAVFRQVLELTPADPEVLNNLAAALRVQGKLDEASACCQQALRLRPGFAEAYHNLGNVLLDQDRLDEALTHYDLALQAAPLFAQAHVSRGRTLQSAGRLTEATAAYRQALQINPAWLDAYFRLGDVLLLLNQTAEAQAVYERAVRVRPDSAEVYNGLGNAAFAQGKMDQAESCYQSALALRLDFAAARYNLGVAYQAQGRLVEAWTCYEEALRLKPDDHVAHSTYVGSFIYGPHVDASALLEKHRLWAECHAPFSPVVARHENVRDPARPLRVGYVSPDFRSHAVAYFLEPILAHHDPTQVVAYCYADVAAPDATTARMRARTSHWRDTLGLSDARLVQLILQDRIDILVDLVGHTAAHRLRVFARKPAPVQVSYLGYPATTGVSAIDYRLVDAVTDPLGEPEGHTEELVRLPGAFCCYAPPEHAPVVSPLPAGQRGFVTFGSLHKLEKLNSAVIDLWCQLLKEVPGARLLLCRNTLHGKTAERLLRQFADRGIERGRVGLHPVQAVNLQHLQVYQEIDVALDPFPWGGHTMACEALWMGVPVISLRGHRHSGRMVTSILSTLGMAGWVAGCPEDYVRIAATLAADVRRLTDLRGRLRGTMAASTLCDGAGFTHGLEVAYRRMWQRWCERED